MVSSGLVLLALVAAACGQSGMTIDEIIQEFDDSTNQVSTLTLVSEDLPVWPEQYAELVGGPEDDETAPSGPSRPRPPGPHITKDVGGSTVWKLLLVLGVLFLVLVGVLTTVYYLCVWRGGRFYYERQKEVSV